MRNHSEKKSAKVNDNLDFENLNDAWYPPHQLLSPLPRCNEHEWHVWEDPWPFHVCQKGIGDCWLMGVLMAISRKLMAISRKKELLEQIIPKRYLIEQIIPKR
ncbi:hypothetical protein GCK72_020732 [Caenorhabditis remanei]|uniref:Calpain catalytic domain-containing protein n=1 Tax=Caenorhabditis remanei TaxID=31234 RepID=A0A6A5GI05_CAERE|nr:hypothetical protein GCK72_020732 [Caenorhabditis remanei]KAF1754172.1 hypothetical protein GCK72_020732 [Caenorhabditis remanei]